MIKIELEKYAKGEDDLFRILCRINFLDRSHLNFLIISTYDCQMTK